MRATLILVAAAFLAPASPRERIHEALSEALAAIGRTPAGLAVRDVLYFERAVAAAGRAPPFPLPGATDPLRPAVVDRALRSPLAALDLGLDLLKGRWPDALQPFAGGGAAPADADAGWPEDLPPAVRRLAARLAGLEDRLRAAGPLLGEPEAAAVWLLDSIPPPDLGRARRAFGGFRAAPADRLAEGAAALVRSLRAADFEGTAWPREAPRRFGTARGDILLGTPGNDVHEAPAWLAVDPGGDDLWRGGAGAGIGRAALALDLAGNDRYEAEGAFAQGAARCGVGLLVDLAGDDAYAGGDFCQGAAAGGVGILRDAAGDDSYSADRFAQGAAAFGRALLLDDGGRDRYRIGKLGQGLARTAGTALLLDRAGDDAYEAEERYESMYSQWTGGRKLWWSFAQGCGLGFYCRYEEPDGSGGTRLVTREMFPGGAGFLIDESGDDSYRGSMYAQGTAYFYGLGVCADLAGNDRYAAGWYGQGAAPHFAAGILADGGGDDVYEGMHQVQGNGRDFSTGVLVDLGGNDRYRAEDRVQGCGDLRDGYGLFVDLAGDDEYEAKAKTARGYAADDKAAPDDANPWADVGVFLDLGGKDRYLGPAAGGDGRLWKDGRTGRGVGLDR